MCFDFDTGDKKMNLYLTSDKCEMLQRDVTEMGLNGTIVITFLFFTSELDNREFRYLIGFQIHERGRGPATLAG